jgi:hypothetical protein
MANLKIASMAIVMAAILVLPLATTYVHGQATGQVTIAETCGLNLNSTTFGFGTLAIGTTSGIDDERIQFTNLGTVDADVTVYGYNWLSGGTEHIGAELTKYSRSTDGTDGQGVSYASKIALNSTDSEPIGDTFGLVEPFPNVNNTSWQLLATVTDLPFSGLLQQDITFTATCAP